MHTVCYIVYCDNKHCFSGEDIQDIYTEYMLDYMNDTEERLHVDKVVDTEGNEYPQMASDLNYWILEEEFWWYEPCHKDFITFEERR